MAYQLGIYVPDCNDPKVRAEFATLCSYPYDVRVQICERQPSLCQSGPAAPSIWEPIVGTVEKIVEPFGKIYSATGQAIEATGQTTIGIGQLALSLNTILPIALVVAGIYFLQRR